MLYLMAQHCYDIKDNNKEIFLLKVGMSRNLTQRMNSYKTENPSATLIYSTAGTEREELRCHRYLATKGTKYCGEWYSVPKDFFDTCMKQGFANFPLKNKNQKIRKRY